VTLTANPSDGSSFTGWTGACSGTARCSLTLESDTAVGAILSAAPPGAGLASLKHIVFMVQEHIASGALRPIIRGWSMAPLPLHIVYPPNKHLSNKLRIFVDWAAELFARSKLIQQREAASV